MRIKFLILYILIFSVLSIGSAAEQTGVPICAHNDPEKFTEVKAHVGAGKIRFMTLLGPEVFPTNIRKVQCGIIPPHCGIGEHIHRDIEEVYVVFNAPAEFTVNGRTALLPAGATVLCPKGSSHGIYNNSDVPLEWMNIGVYMEKGKDSDCIDYGDSLTTEEVESPAPFQWAQINRSLLKPYSSMHEGTGEVFDRTLWSGDSFKTNMCAVWHAVIPPGSSIGYHRHGARDEIYYIMSGSGRMTVNDHTWVVRPGDTIPCTIGDSHGLYNNTNEDIEIFGFSVWVEKGAKRAVTDWNDDLTDR